MLAQGTTVNNILDTKGGDVISVSSESDVAQAARILSENRIGVLAVKSPAGKFVGLLSERDIVKAVGASPEINVAAMPVADLMTKNIIACAPEADLHEVLDTMREQHFRHMPVVHDGVIRGMVSRTDIVEHARRNAELGSEEELWSRFLSEF